ncbi:MAG: DUF3854 domain-containing protein, partial [Candidatus Rokubacteria bacterium]|nr:DUF3854 domain-containing protein [Candidatus Rokubacteria bacterium]
MGPPVAAGSTPRDTPGSLDGLAPPATPGAGDGLDPREVPGPSMTSGLARGDAPGSLPGPDAGDPTPHGAPEPAQPAARATSALSLHTEALDDLRRSGLSDATIIEAGLHTPPPGDLARLLGPRLAEKVRHVLVFPYEGASLGCGAPRASAASRPSAAPEGGAASHGNSSSLDSGGSGGGPRRRDNAFLRCKLFPPVPDGQGHTMRYYQRAGTPPRLYIPARAHVPLLITEGEKKALKANQDGLACMAVGGLWNWQHGGRPIADLDRIDWCARETGIVPDSDVWTRPDLLQPVFALGKEIEGRGARVSVLKLPSGPDGAKVGLDDYLCAQPLDAFTALPRLVLKHAAFSRTSAWWRGWVKRKEEPDEAGAEGTALDLLERVDAVRVLHPAQDVADGVLWYGLPVDKALVVIASTRQAYRADQLPTGLGLRHAEPGPSTVSREAAVRWLTTGESGSIARALDALADFFPRYVVLRDRRTALWIAAWTLATWCYRAFRVFPYLSIRSAEKRCGKSRLLGLLARVCFNASPVTAHPTEAQLYRSAARTGGAQLLDEVETLRGDKDRFDALISVLNVGFERGGVVTRLEKRGERFVEEPYEVYAPRVLAGIMGLKDTLEDRALPLFMLRRRRSEPVARLGRSTDTDAQSLRDQCALACLTHIQNVLTAYDGAPTLLEQEGIDDRAVDLWSPLVAITLVADAEDDGSRTRQLLDLARDLGTVRDADAEAGTTARLLEALEALRAKIGETPTPAELLEALRARSGWEWLK